VRDYEEARRLHAERGGYLIRTPAGYRVTDNPRVLAKHRKAILARRCDELGIFDEVELERLGRHPKSATR